MTILRSIAMAFSMFSKIPAPGVNWEKANMRYILVAFPLIGLVNCAVLFAWYFFGTKFAVNNILYSAGLTLFPIFLTGGIHLDGFCDTMDALSSHASPERKREILKDPNAGAFAVIYLGVYLLAYFALCTEQLLSLESVAALGAISVGSRAVAGFASLTFPTSKGGGLLDTFRNSGGKISAIICVIWFILAASAAVIFSNFSVLFGFAIAVVYVRAMSKRQFGGMSGDLAGFLICLTELLSLAAITIFNLGGKLL
jgi:adenosylcobinamide-GDP ribazoletransferase